MSVIEQTPYQQALGNGVTTLFPFNFLALIKTDLSVYVAGVLKIVDVDYTVSGLGVVTGGSVTFSVAPANGLGVDIIRTMARTRSTDYQNLGDFNADVVDLDFDRAILLAQDLYTQIGRSIRTPANEVATLPTLPSIANRVGKYISFDAAGQPIASIGTGNDTALRTDLASTGVGTDGARLLGYSRTEAGAVARVVATVLGENILARDFGVVANGVVDDTTGLINAIAAAAQVAGGAQGSVVWLPIGTTVLSSMVTLPNRVSIRGQGARGSVLQAKAGFSGAFVLNAVNGVSSMFNSLLIDLSVDANDIAGLGCILSDAWQEDSGCRRCLLQKFRTYGIKYQNGYGGASYNRVEDTEIFASASGATAGIRVEQISSVGAFKLHILGCVVAGTNLPKGIDVVNDSLLVQGLHMESVLTEVYLDGVGRHVIETLTGKAGNTSLVELASTFTGGLEMSGCFRNATTNYLLDGRAGQLGTITGYDIPLLVTSNSAVASIRSDVTASAWCVFNGTSGTPITPSGSFNVTNVTKSATGTYRVNLTRAMKSVNAACFGSCNLATSGTHVRVGLVGSSSFDIFVYVAGVLTDASEVKGIIFGG